MVNTDCTGFLNYVDWSLNEAHPMSFSSRNISLDTLLSMRNPDCGGQAAMQAATEMFVDVSTLQRVEAEVRVWMMWRGGVVWGCMYIGCCMWA